MGMGIPGFVLAAPESGSGKTTVAAGLVAALCHRGFRVQTFKVGPDYIDPTYLTAASGRPCHNLDGFLTAPETVSALYARYAASAELTVVEGVMGLYDGLGSEGAFSTAWTAKHLGLPVVLVVECRGHSSTSLAAVIHGFRSLPHLAPDIVGVVLNRTPSEERGLSLREAVERLTQLPVLGCLPSVPEISFPSRHLGLWLAFEHPETVAHLNTLGALMERHLDMESIVRCARPTSLVLKMLEPPHHVFARKPCIAVAKDRAFSFYYEANLDLLRDLGAEIASIRPTEDETLPKECRGIYLGGGYPEEHLDALAQNTPFLNALRDAARRGIPIYAECGGMMYLGESITGKSGIPRTMAGLFPLRSFLSDRLQRFGYVSVRAEEDTLLHRRGEIFSGHEFHYSISEGVLPTAYTVRKASRPTLAWSEGYRHRGILGSYVHLHWWHHLPMAQRFVSSAGAGA